MSNLAEITGFLEHLGDAIIIVNDSSDIIYANPACSKLFGYSKKNIHTMAIENLMVPSQKTNHRKVVNEYIQSKSSARAMMTRAQLPCVDSSGNTFNARISIASVTIDKQLFGVATIQDFTSLQKEIENLEITSHQDTLTGLFNRRYLQKITKPNSRILRTWKNIGLIYLDLNKFKPINDQYGHEVGDAVLKVVSNRIKGSIRFDDIVFRMGGDEFLVFINLNNILDKRETIRNIAVKIQQEVTKPLETEYANISVGLSAGCGIYPENDSDMMKLVAKTDKAMYSAKKTGIHISFVETS